MAKVRLQWKGEEFVQAVGAAAGAALTETAMHAENEVRKLYQEKTGGKVIGKTKKGRKKYRSAPPGAYPGIRMGGAGLLGSIGHTRASVGKATSRNALTARVGTNKEHGAYLEHGTSRMAARPWLGRSIKASTKKLRGVFARAMERELRAKATRI